MHLDRVVTVLETVAVAGRPVSASELQTATGLPRPTCYRLLQTLAENGLLDMVENGAKYLVGQRLMRLALLGQTDTDVRTAAAPAMKEAAVQFGEAVFLSRFRNKGVEIIHVEVPTDPSRSFIHPGLGYRPMHACSCSKAIAAFAEEAFRNEILAGPMRAYTEFTKRDAKDLAAEFDQIQIDGFAQCVEEIEMGVSSVAAPVRVGNIGATFSIGATGPIRRFTAPRRAEIGAQLTVLAAKVATTLQLYGAGDLRRLA
jgi:IclR family acetate operon transcriptional repressor